MAVLKIHFFVFLPSEADLNKRIIANLNKIIYEPATK